MRQCRSHPCKGIARVCHRALGKIYLGAESVINADGEETLLEQRLNVLHVNVLSRICDMSATVEKESWLGSKSLYGLNVRDQSLVPLTYWPLYSGRIFRFGRRVVYVGTQLETINLLPHDCLYRNTGSLRQMVLLWASSG